MTSPQSPTPPNLLQCIEQHALFSIGFRPFFFVGILFSGLTGLVWAAFWSGTFNINITPLGGMTFWHAHEMLQGFTLAIISGFLLTAVQNWTGMRTITPIPLLLLVTIWLFARITMALSSELPWSVVLISQLLPILGIAFCIARPILKARMWRNLFVPCILTLFALLEIHILFQAEMGNSTSHLFITLVLLVTIFVCMISGRVFPFFIANRLRLPKKEEPKPLFLLCVLPLAAMALIYLTGLSSNSWANTLLGVLALTLAISNGLRLLNWYPKRIWQEHMLWSLWLFYACLPIGFLVISINLILELGLGNLPLHILTIGAIGGLIVSMVSRVSKGHTGRVIAADIPILTAFFLLGLALAFRTVLPAIHQVLPTYYVLSSLFWGLAFGIMFIRFAKIWYTPRPDQQ